MFGLNIQNSIAIGAIIVTVGSWFTTSYLTSVRERDRKREEMRVAYLVDAYDKLVAASNRITTPTSARDVEEAVARIQLFGSEAEIQILHKIIDEYYENLKKGQPRASLDPLIFILRNGLRDLMGQERVSSPVRWIRP